jgi:hypothetical protein
VRCDLQDETLNGFLRNFRRCLSRTHILHVGGPLSRKFGQAGSFGPWCGPSWLQSLAPKLNLRHRTIGLN